MKLRHPWLIKVAGFLGSLVLRLWIRTLRSRFHSVGRSLDPRQKGLKDRFIYSFWHEGMLFPAYFYAQSDIYVLVSYHADGQLISEIGRHMGFPTIRGSTTRGGVEAMREMMRTGRHGHVAITPDGPRGPRRQVKPGVVYLASRTGLPIVPAGIGFDRPWRMKSWDRFVLPRPWSLATVVTAEPIHVPADADNETLERYRQRVEEAMHWATEVAERWAETGKLANLSN